MRTSRLSLSLAFLTATSVIAGCPRRNDSTASRPGQAGSPTVVDTDATAALPAPGVSDAKGEDADATSGDASNDSGVPSVLRAQMSAWLYGNPEFRFYVCGDDACSLGTFEESLEYEPVVLRVKPPAIGYFVDKKDVIEVNYYTGVFVVQEGSLGPRFVFFGSSLVIDPAHRDHGFARLNGVWRTSNDTWAELVYAWNGTRYVQISSKQKSSR